MLDNNNRISPFSTTPGIAGDAYINIHYADDIINNFESSYSTQFVYKILGLRGSGKSVEYKRVMDYFVERPDWKVYALSAGGNKIQALIGALSLEPDIDSSIKTSEYSISGNISAAPFGLGAGTAFSSKKSVTCNQALFSEEVMLETMCRAICTKGYKILIGIDDIAKDDSMVSFLSIIGKFILDNKINIRLICTGLYKNVEDFTELPHLSFFVSPKALVVESLIDSDMVYMYRKFLDMDMETAKALAKSTRGYAWGYSLLGDIYYTKNPDSTLEDVYEIFDQRIASTYHLIWKEMTAGEQEFVKIILSTETGAKEEIEKKMKTKGYSSLRMRLYSKHIIDISQKGHIKIDLPRFKEYVEEWQD